MRKLMFSTTLIIAAVAPGLAAPAADPQSGKNTPAATNSMSGMDMSGSAKSKMNRGGSKGSKMNMKGMGGANAMSGMGGMSGMKMSSSIDLEDPMNRESSGTAWAPDSTPMYGKMIMRNGNMIMLHGAIWPRYTQVGSARGDYRFDAPNWAMGMFGHPLDSNSQLGIRLMMSLDPLIESKRGYPLLYQTGETAGGAPLHDRQHPHDLFAELSATYSRRLSSGSSAYLYVGYPGEPALGPPTFMHRLSAMDNPDAPIGHHWQDSTHITFGVLTAGFSHKNIKVEASAFKGREPDEYRYNFDPPKLDSYSGRISWNPSANLALQVSHGFRTSPEVLEPTTNDHRTTASAIYNLPLGPDANWSNSLVWGQNLKPGEGRSNSYLAETDYQRGANTWYGRIEQVQKSGNELVLNTPAISTHLFNVGSYTAGYVRDLKHNDTSGIDVGLGGQVTLNPHPSSLDSFYNSSLPVGFEVFLRIRPSRHDHPGSSMAGMQMPGMNSGSMNGQNMPSAGGASHNAAPPPAETGSVTVTSTPDAPKVGPNLVTLTLRDASGKPLSGANVKGTVAMATMDMGTTHPTFKELRNGQYVGTVSFSMAGPWRLKLNIVPHGGGPAVTKDMDYNVTP